MTSVWNIIFFSWNAISFFFFFLPDEGFSSDEKESSAFPFSLLMDYKCKSKRQIIYCRHQQQEKRERDFNLKQRWILITSIFVFMLFCCFVNKTHHKNRELMLMGFLSFSLREKQKQNIFRRTCRERNWIVECTWDKGDIRSFSWRGH